MAGVLKVQVVKGTDLAVRDMRSSDPYVILTLGNHTRRTRVINNNLNPVWKEDFTFPIKTTDSCLLKVEIWDNDTWTPDDRMGDADIDLKPLFEKQEKHKKVVSQCTENSLYKDSSIIQCGDGKKVQEALLKLRNVDTGLLTLQFEWPLPL